MGCEDDAPWKSLFAGAGKFQSCLIIRSWRALRREKRAINDSRGRIEESTKEIFPFRIAPYSSHCCSLKP